MSFEWSDVGSDDWGVMNQERTLTGHGSQNNLPGNLLFEERCPVLFRIR
jgi:hypothetical protein